VLDPDLLLDDASRDRLLARFGTEVDSWFAALPQLVEQCCVRWHLELDTGLSGSTSRVFTGRQHGERGVVLKLTPDLSIANQEALALSAWAGTPHAVDLLDADLTTGALLLEKIEPGTKLGDEPELPPVTEVAELLTGLRAATSDYEDQLPTLAQRVEFLFSRIGSMLSDPRVSALVAPPLVTRGKQLARELASNGPTGLVHGDLHLPSLPSCREAPAPQ
jgi:streptomycin 6-kinase